MAAGIDLELMMEQHVPRILQESLAQRLGLSLQNKAMNELEWHAIGKAKYHEFTPGKKFSNRPRRSKKSQRTPAVQNRFRELAWTEMNLIPAVTAIEMHAPAPETLPPTWMALEWSL